MSRATFIAVDPQHRIADRNQLQDLLVDIRGLADWNIDSNGRVTVDYNHEETSSNVIEEALAGAGYQVEHVHDDARLGKADAPNLGVESSKGGKQYGK